MFGLHDHDATFAPTYCQSVTELFSSKPMSTGMNTIHRLREVLSRVLASPDTSHNGQELFDELMVQKARLLKLFDVGLRNPQEQREIESGN
jgi:hypothetical protein